VGLDNGALVSNPADRSLNWKIGSGTSVTSMINDDSAALVCARSTTNPGPQSDTGTFSHRNGLLGVLVHCGIAGTRERQAAGFREWRDGTLCGISAESRPHRRYNWWISPVALFFQ
jgi:hypothetical protein